MSQRAANFCHRASGSHCTGSDHYACHSHPTERPLSPFSTTPSSSSESFRPHTSYFPYTHTQEHAPSPHGILEERAPLNYTYEGAYWASEQRDESPDFRYGLPYWFLSAGSDSGASGNASLHADMAHQSMLREVMGRQTSECNGGGGSGSDGVVAWEFCAERRGLVEMGYWRRSEGTWGLRLSEREKGLSLDGVYVRSRGGEKAWVRKSRGRGKKTRTVFGTRGDTRDLAWMDQCMMYGNGGKFRCERRVRLM